MNRDYHLQALAGCGYTEHHHYREREKARHNTFLHHSSKHIDIRNVFLGERLRRWHQLMWRQVGRVSMTFLLDRNIISLI